ncbi:MAG: HAD-IA family hydrolase [Syntrophales bacterium]|nr:HAD-IA family hydrolase [Syntrophales bacterium]
MDLLIFDLDGTLAYTGRDIAKSVNYTLRSLGLREIEEEKILSFVGNGVRNLLLRSLTEEHIHFLDEALRIFKGYYSEHLLDSTVLTPGARECLEFFRDKIKVILSNKDVSFIDRVIAGLGIKSFFDDVIGGDTFPYRKPDPRVVEYILAKFKIEPKKAIIIGDGPNDIIAAKNAGVLCCAFLNGLTKREDLLSLDPDITCENLGELRWLIQ